MLFVLFSLSWGSGNAVFKGITEQPTTGKGDSSCPCSASSHRACAGHACWVNGLILSSS